ncbi:hypothetical protein [Vibrio harveyi]|uniref:hypothetical protein n=1 Tax=Vibrio harveyi TaxID=669 RepID=UPI0024B7EC92|nr:hypothetical protein [Vibrio harveyi]WHP63959.1 hypothetical protein QMY49_05330 [Vibrio harveyi]
MESLALEYFKLVDVISQYDGYLMMIKGWSITVSLAIFGYAFQQANRSILLLAAVSSISFYLMDVKFKEYQLSYYPRMKAIERCVHAVDLELNVRISNNSCELFKIDQSWVDAKKSGRFVDGAFHFGSIFPHVILLLLSILLYFKPLWLLQKES